VSTVADAVATAAFAETARLLCAELAAAYWATLRRVYTRKSIGGGVCARRRNAAESPVAALLAARRLVAASPTKEGTSRFHRTLIGMLSAAARTGAAWAPSMGSVGQAMRIGSRTSRVRIRMCVTV
jgi:hypothetical protein